jgi:hypothetical protein
MNGIIAFIRFVDRINYVLWQIRRQLDHPPADGDLPLRGLHAAGSRNSGSLDLRGSRVCILRPLHLAIGYTLYYKEHVNVDIIVNRYSEKTQAIIEILTYLFFIGMFVYFLMPAAYNFAERSWMQGELAPTGANLPVYPGKTLIPLGIAFLAIQAIAHVLKNLVFVLTGRKI